MSRRKFDCYMLHLQVGTHPKLAHLTDGEFRATIAGVFPLAAMASIRGRLLVGDQRVEPAHVSGIARVSPKVARSAMEKLRLVSVIVDDPDLDCEMVHDFEDWNPAPREDKTNAERQARHREKLRRNGGNNAGNNAEVTVPVTPPEVEGEVEGEVTTDASHPVEPSRLDDARQQRQTVEKVFAHWQAACNHPAAKLTADRRRKVEGRLREGYTEQQILTAVDGAARGAFVNDDGKRFDDLELICRSGSKLEAFIDRATQVAKPPSSRGSSAKDHEQHLFDTKVAAWVAADPDTDHTDERYAG